jgi:hypothetical protein
MRFLISAIFVLTTSISMTASAYPDFIGFGYRNCIVCHENSTGGGALTDYGRGVYASEISANPLSKWLNAEETSGISNFLFATELPWWVRIGYKFRQLTVQSSPGSANTRNLYYNMQNDLNLNFFADEKHNIGLISTIGYLENAVAIAPNKAVAGNERVFLKEYFVKYRINKEWLVQLGMQDKAFGIKTANHTAVNRAQIGVGNNDQTHGLLVQNIKNEYDLFLMAWAGNLHLPKPGQSAGGSIMYEGKYAKSNTYGAAILSEKKETVKLTNFEVHNKMGFGEGNMLLMELGHSEKELTVSGITSNTRSDYLFTQGNISLTQGYFIMSDLEFSKVTAGTTSLETLKWELGFLTFPIQRVELRGAVVNKKTYNAPEAAEDQWSIYTQLHLSL